MIGRASALAAALVTAGSLGAVAQQTCGGEYTVKPGDSLSLIADRLYKDVGQWTVIYRTNISVIPSPDSIRVGQKYRMPCIDGLPVGLKGGTVVQADSRPVAPPVIAATAAPQITATAAQAQRQRATEERRAGVDVKLLVADDFKPFTNRLYLSSGLITDVVNRAYVANSDTGQHKFYWVNDRSVHLDPMLSEGMVDVAFPWKKPDCAAAPSADLCTNFVYSEPMFEMLVVLFTAKGSGVTYRREADLDGMRICSPLSHSGGDRAGTSAAYMKSAGARLQLPNTAEDCFSRLVDGTADAVAMNEFTGRVVLKDMGLDNRVELQLSRPLAIEGLHAVAHKSNPRAEELIAAFNDGLGKMRDSGEYLSVIDKHMSSIWAGL